MHVVDIVAEFCAKAAPPGFARYFDAAFEGILALHAFQGIVLAAHLPRIVEEAVIVVALQEVTGEQIHLPALIVDGVPAKIRAVHKQALPRVGQRGQEVSPPALTGVHRIPVLVSEAQGPVAAAILRVQLPAVAKTVGAPGGQSAQPRNKPGGAVDFALKQGTEDQGMSRRRGLVRDA